MREILRIKTNAGELNYPTIDDRIIVIDDFFDHPDRVRHILQNSQWEDFCSPSEGRLGIGTTNSRIQTTVIDRLTHLVFKQKLKIYGCYTRLTTKEILPHHIHTDNSLSCFIYLTPPQFCQGGTAIVSPKDKNLNRIDLIKYRYKIDHWETQLEIPMKFNRCLIMDGKLFHTRLGSFGDNFDNGRLTINTWISQVGDESTFCEVEDGPASPQQIENSSIPKHLLENIKNKLI